MKKKYVLCQNCANIEKYTLAKHHDLISCKCGGQFCGCPKCHNDLIKIKILIKELKIHHEDILYINND